MELFHRHQDQLILFTTALQERRCRRTRHFDEHIEDTMTVFRPLFAPWNMEILFFLYMRGPQRFNVIKHSLAGISGRVLSDKLQHLATEGLLERDEQGPQHVEYGLSPKGLLVARHLHPLLFALRNLPT